MAPGRYGTRGKSGEEIECSWFAAERRDGFEFFHMGAEAVLKQKQNNRLRPEWFEDRLG